MAIIYKTTCLINGKIYIGQHYTDSNDRYLGSGYLIKKAIIKYGKNNFKREILEECDIEIINDREIYWIDLLHSRDSKIGYNLAIGGSPYNGVGLQHSYETKRKMSISHIGIKRIKHSTETKKKMSRSHIGIIPSFETRQKMSIANKGKNKGKHYSEDHRKKISQSRKGMVFSQYTKNLMSKIRIGKKRGHYKKI